MNNEFYYYDGEIFQKCLTLNNTKVPVNKEYEDLAYFISDNTVETFLTVGKIENKCLYDLENTKAHFYMLTNRGFELVTTESMNVRAMGLDTKDFVDITVKPVLLVSINERFNINKLDNLKDINTYEVANPVVRVVPIIGSSEYFNLAAIDLNNLSRKENIKILLNEIEI